MVELGGHDRAGGQLPTQCLLSQYEGEGLALVVQDVLAPLKRAHRGDELVGVHRSWRGKENGGARLFKQQLDRGVALLRQRAIDGRQLRRIRIVEQRRGGALALFRTRQDNYAMVDGDKLAPNGDSAYVAALYPWLFLRWEPVIGVLIPAMHSLQYLLIVWRYQLNLERGELTGVRSNPVPIDSSYISTPRSISFPTGDDETAHAIFYPPSNPDFRAPEGELPPLMVRTHGGPTGQVASHLNPSYLYWTTRGFALVDVNYRGSTGYGKAYRNRLRGGWGIIDVEDAIAVVRYLADEGEIDPDRVTIRGGSAGGYTTLAALATGEGTFKAGASYYGVAECALLAEHTHKFESRYLDGLVGTDPEEMRRRSPLHSADQIKAPVILFQGLEDKVVPPEQSEMIAAALKENRVPYAHITYDGEGHGFRQAENIVHSLESELAFYGLVFGFTPHGDLPELPLVGEITR